MNKGSSMPSAFGPHASPTVRLQECFPVGYFFRPRPIFSRGLASKSETILFDSIQMVESRVLRVTSLPPRVDNQLVFDVEYSCVSCDGSGASEFQKSSGSRGRPRREQIIPARNVDESIPKVGQGWLRCEDSSVPTT
jgi:hypothetical protein